MVQIADLFGEHGVGFLVAMTNGLVVDLLAWPWIRRRHGAVGPNTALVVPALAWLGAFVGAWGYGHYRIGQFDASAPSAAQIRVAVVQTNVPQDNKNNPSPQQLIQDWQRLLALTHQAAGGKGTDLVVWPETMVPAGLNDEAVAQYSLSDSLLGMFHRQIQSLARELETHLVVGAHGYDDWKTVPPHDTVPSYRVPTKRYNTVYLYRTDGTQWTQRYDKIHRVPFGEYIPWVDRWPWLKQRFVKHLSPYDSDYTLQPGRALTLFPVSPQGDASTAKQTLRISTPVCFEDAVARVTRTMVFGEGGLKRTDLLINLTNDGWYAGTHQGPQHLQNAVLRCVENRVPMARSVNTGISGFIDSVGRVGPLVTEDGRHQQVEGTATHTMVVDTRQTVFGRWGHGTLLCPMALAGVAMARSARRR